MIENKNGTNKFKAIVVDPQTDKLIAKVCMEGETFPTSDWVNTQGNLQRFEILDEKKGFWEAWVDQRDVVLRTEHSQRVVKITTYPTDGETQGFLNYISDVKDSPHQPAQIEDHLKPKGKLTFLRTLFGA